MLWHSKSLGNPGGRRGKSYALEIQMGGIKEVWKSRWGGGVKMLPSVGGRWIFSRITHCNQRQQGIGNWCIAK